MTIEDMNTWRDIFARAVRFVATKEGDKTVLHLETPGMLAACSLCALLRDAFDDAIKAKGENP